MSINQTNSFNKSSCKRQMYKQEKSDNEINNNNSFLSNYKTNESPKKIYKINILGQTGNNPKTSYSTRNNVGNKENKEKIINKDNKEKKDNKINKEKRENKERKENKIKEENKEIKDFVVIKENSLKNQNEFNPNRVIKPRRNASVQQRKRSSNSINLNSFFPKAAHQSSTSGIIGLSSEGQNSDFINAVIQCFSNIGRFRIGLLDLESKLSNKIITSSLIKVLKNLWLVLNHRIYSPKKFIDIINKNFKSSYNLKEFIQFLLNNIHKELKSSNDSNLIATNDFKLSHDYKENINKFQYFKNIYEKTNDSIISKEFVGFLEILDICEHCHQGDKITIKTFETLSFNLDGAINTIKNNCISINQCFKYYYGIKKENIKCNKCNLIKYKKCDLLFMPRTLIITLNYGNKTKTKFIYEEYLNLTHFVTYNKESPYYYELVGIIVNLQNNQNGNHFISYCKNSNNCFWYKYDNDIVVRSSIIDVTSHDQPFVLFYSYITA